MRKAHLFYVIKVIRSLEITSKSPKEKLDDVLKVLYDLYFTDEKDSDFSSTTLSTQLKVVLDKYK